MKIILILLLLLPAVYASADDAVVMVTEEYPPYEYMAGGKLIGLDIDIIEAASKRLGVHVDIHMRPWVRGMKEVKEGTVDAMFSMFINEERESFLYFATEPLGSEKIVLITNIKSTKQANKLKDLAGWMIGTVKDNSYGKEFDEYTGITRHEVTNIEQLIMMAVTGDRFDAATVNEYVLAYYVKQMGIQGRIKKLDFIVTDQPLYIGFSKAKGSATKNLAADYSRVIKELRQEGIIDGIIQRYMTQ